MGLLGDWLRGRRMKDPVRGTAQIVGCSRYTQPATSSNIAMTLVVSAEGIPAHGRPRVLLPPRPLALSRRDDTLPVTVDRADPARLKVEWEEVPTHEQRIAEQAQALAAHMNEGAVGGAPGADLVDHLRAAFPGAQITVSSHAPKFSDLTGGDAVERLKRLAALHRSGALTDEEFAAAKARLLG